MIFLAESPHYLAFSRSQATAEHLALTLGRIATSRQSNRCRDQKKYAHPLCSVWDLSVDESYNPVSQEATLKASRPLVQQVHANRA
jgi:hypothetical protein